MRRFGERFVLHYVYLIESLSTAGERYLGLTENIRRRLDEHNSGKARYSSRYRPWQLVAYVAFRDRSKAASFERYLKSGSGHAFAKKRLW